MTYYNAIIQNDTGVSETIRTAVRTAMDAHVAWEYVESVDISTNRYDVYRSLGTANGLNADYYVTIRFPITPGTATLIMLLHEEWDAVGKTAAKVAPTNSTTYTPDATGGFNTSTGVILSSNIFGTHVTLALNATLTEYYISLTDKRLVFVTRVGTASYGGYTGQFLSYYSGDTMPLVNGYITASVTSGAGVFTRNWARLGLSTTSAFATTSYLGTAQITNAFSSVGATPDFYAEGKWTFSRGVVQAINNTNGGVRGELIDVAMPTGTVNLAIGDTVTIDGVVYVFLGHNYWLNTGA